MSKSTDTQKIFVSYSHDDSKEVLPLVERLERETGVQFWIDREGIESAEQFVEVIIRAIDRAEIVLFMLSDNSQHSHWTKNEVTYAKNIGKRVVPIVLNGSDLKGWFLFTFGRVNYIDSSEEDQLQRLVKDLRQWLNIGKETAPKPTPATSSSTASSGTINGHEYVDLGLSVRWATCNIGASSPEDYGDYYAWGDKVNNKSCYDEVNCATLKKRIGNISGTLRDVAHVKWGGSWRMPTLAECDELVDKCTWTWTTQGGHNGYKVTGPNGNSIFLPAAGDRCGTSLYNAGKSGNYWSSTPDYGNTYLTYSLGFYGGSHGSSEDDRSSGLSVRPVTE